MKGLFELRVESDPRCTPSRSHITAPGFMSCVCLLVDEPLSAASGGKTEMILFKRSVLYFLHAN